MFSDECSHTVLSLILGMAMNNIELIYRRPFRIYTQHGTHHRGRIRTTKLYCQYLPSYEVWDTECSLDPFIISLIPSEIYIIFLLSSVLLRRTQHPHQGAAPGRYAASVTYQDMSSSSRQTPLILIGSRQLAVRNSNPPFLHTEQNKPDASCWLLQSSPARKIQ